MPHTHAYPPRLMKAQDAAEYLGTSKTKLLGLGIPRVIMGGNRSYDRRALDDYADNLPIEGQEEGENSCDEAFG